MSNRREHVPFDPRFFEKQAERHAPLSMSETFRHIHRTNHWSNPHSASGDGAARYQTQQLEVQLPGLLRRLEVDVLLDLPCGDFSWMQHVDLPVSRYIGADIVPALVRDNQTHHGSDARVFMLLDLTSDPLPAADLLLCRDCLVHLGFSDIDWALRNIARSSIDYLLTTTFPACETNEEITTGDWRLLNLQRPPFNFPAPHALLDEHCTEADGRCADKSLGLWRVEDLPVANTADEDEGAGAS